MNGDFILVLRGHDISAIRSDVELANKIEKEMGQKVWFVETEASDRRFIESLFHPMKVLSVNFFWLPESNKLTKVIIAGEAERAEIDLEKIQRIAKAVRNIELLVEFKNSSKRT